MSHIKRFKQSQDKAMLLMESKPCLLTCDLCSKEAHHIHHKDHNNKNQDKENLQPLCTSCHSKIHGIEARVSEIKRLVILLNRTQKARIAINNQISAFKRIELTVPQHFQDLITALEAQEKDYEKQIKKMVENGNYPTAKWLLGIKGIKHVLAAKLLAYIDFSRTNGVGKLWAYAGLTPSSKKTKGKKSNWNQELRMVCAGQIADSFIKHNFSGKKPNKIPLKYRNIYDQEKAKQLKLMDPTTCKMKSSDRLKDSSDQIQEVDLTTMQPKHRIATSDCHGTLSPSDALSPSGSVPNSLMHAHKRAIRKMIKEFLKDYYLAGTTIKMKPNRPLNQPSQVQEDKTSPFMKSNINLSNLPESSLKSLKSEVI